MYKISETICTLIISLCLINLASCEIRFAFEMFRHGARAPIALKSKGLDIYNETWNMDSELTEVGMRQHYLIGYRNRKNYQDFLSNSFDPNEMLVISTNYNRTIMSAYSQLQGLFPDGTGPKLTAIQQANALPPINDIDYTSEIAFLGNNSLPNQADVYPIHIFDSNSRYFSLRKVCPGIEHLIKENTKKQLLKDYVNNFNSTYGEKFKKILNVTSDYFFDYNNLWKITDTFVCDYTDGKEMKALSDANIDFVEFNKTATEFLSIDILDISSGDKENLIALVSMSPTGLDILKWMQNRIFNDINNIGYSGYVSPKFVMYSAHDTDMGLIQRYLQSTLNFENIYYTPFASSIFFELYRQEKFDPTALGENDYYVIIDYNNHKTRIEFVDFKKGISENSYSTDQIASFCKFKVDSSSNSRFYIITTFIFGFIALALVVIVGCVVYRNKNNNDRYSIEVL